jgi:hypothetical protein
LREKSSSHQALLVQSRAPRLIIVVSNYRTTNAQKHSAGALLNLPKNPNLIVETGERFLIKIA